MRLKYLFVYNAILIMMTIGCNLHFTIRTHKEDMLLLTEDKFILTEKLLRENIRKRKQTIIVTVSVCFTLIFNTFARFDIISILIEAIFTLNVILYFMRCLSHLFNYSFVEKQIIIKWVFDIVDDISNLNLSKEDSEKCFDYRVRELIRTRNLSTKKFNRVMKELESEFLEIRRRRGNN